MSARPDMAELIAAAQRFEKHFEELVLALQANAIASRELAHQVAAHNEASRLDRLRRSW